MSDFLIIWQERNAVNMKKNSVLIIVFTLTALSGLAQSKTEQLVLDLSKKKFDWMVNKAI